MINKIPRTKIFTHESEIGNEDFEENNGNCKTLFLLNQMKNEVCLLFQHSLFLCGFF